MRPAGSHFCTAIRPAAQMHSSATATKDFRRSAQIHMGISVAMPDWIGEDDDDDCAVDWDCDRDWPDVLGDEGD